MAKMKRKPEEMVELTLSTDQFRGASNPAQVAQSVQLESTKIMNQLLAVVRSMAGTTDKLLEGARTVDDVTGGITQKLYVSKRIADRARQNVKAQNQVLLSQYEESLVNSGAGMNVLTGDRPVVMAERRYNYESANARRMGIRDIRAAGGYADKAKYRDIDHPYATAMYLPLDKAAYDARSGRSLTGWVQAQFNNAMSGESRNERGYARDMTAQKDDERRRKEEIKEDREDFREQQRKQREQERVQRAEEREQERIERMQERGRIQAQSAAERVQRAEERRRSSAARRQLKQRRARRRAQRAEERAEERQRAAATIAISATLASILTAARSILNSLTDILGTAAGAHRTELPAGFSSETPIVNALTELIGRIPVVGMLAPVMKALLDEVKEVRAQSIAGFFSGLSTSDVRFYNTTDISHGLVSGTTVGAIQSLAERWSSPVRAAENKDAITQSAVIVGDSIGDMFSMGLEGAGITAEGAAEMLLDKFFDAYQKGINTYGMKVSNKTALIENLAAGIGAFAPGLESILRKMMYDSNEGYLGTFSNWEEWLSATRTAKMLSSGILDVPEYKLDLASVIAASFDDIEAQFKASFSKFMLGFNNALMSLFDALAKAQYLLMSSDDKAAARVQARSDLSEASGAYRDKAAEALAAFNRAAGTNYTSVEDVISMKRDWTGAYTGTFASDVSSMLVKGRLNSDAQEALWNMAAAEQLRMTAEYEKEEAWFPVYNAARFSDSNYTNLVESYKQSVTSETYKNNYGVLPNGTLEAFNEAFGGYSPLKLLEQIYGAGSEPEYTAMARNTVKYPMFGALDILDSQLAQLQADIAGDGKYEKFMKLIAYYPKSKDIKYEEARKIYEVLSKQKKKDGSGYVYEDYGLTDADVDFLVSSMDYYEGVFLYDLAIGEGDKYSYKYIPDKTKIDYADQAKLAYKESIEAAGGAVSATGTEETEAAIKVALLRNAAYNAVSRHTNETIKRIQEALGKNPLGVLGITGSSAQDFASAGLRTAYENALNERLAEWASKGGFNGDTTYNLTIPIGNFGTLEMTLENTRGTVNVPADSVNFTAASDMGQ